MSNVCRISHWGLIDYGVALQRQQMLVKEVADGTDATVVLCEHPQVITLGQKSHENNLLLSRDDLAQRGFKIILVDRGGDVTLHAPGQLVLYPILDLRRVGIDLKSYLRGLEQVAVDLLADFGIVAAGSEDRRGVWVGNSKIASIGIGVKRWVTYHGMSVNVSTDLELFKAIRPCGLDVQMTSIEKIIGSAPSMTEVMAGVEKHFQKVFGFREV
jgi:lipoate-protein ligase B